MERLSTIVATIARLGTLKCLDLRVSLAVSFCRPVQPVRSEKLSILIDAVAGERTVRSSEWPRTDSAC